ncbi:MAG: hypothetical protein ACP5LW_06380, partial [Nitrososphaeria archaeon]
MGIDFGTSKITSRVYAEDGGLIYSSVSRSPGIRSPRPGWTEVDPFDYLFVLKRLLRKIMNRTDCRIYYTAISSVAPVFIPVDRDCYPLINGILYNDT